MKFPAIIYLLKQDLMMVRTAVVEDCRLLLHGLEAKGCEYTLFADPNETLIVKMVLKGLPKSAVPYEIKASSQEQKINVILVAQMKKSKDKSRLPLFLITIYKIDYDNLKGRKGLDDARVRLEDYIPPQDVQPCFRCQRWHDTSNRCHAAPKCQVHGGPLIKSMPSDQRRPR